MAASRSPRGVSKAIRARGRFASGTAPVSTAEAGAPGGSSGAARAARGAGARRARGGPRPVRRARRASAKRGTPRGTRARSASNRSCAARRAPAAPWTVPGPRGPSWSKAGLWIWSCTPTFGFGAAHPPRAPTAAARCDGVENRARQARWHTIRKLSRACLVMDFLFRLDVSREAPIERKGLFLAACGLRKSASALVASNT